MERMIKIQEQQLLIQTKQKQLQEDQLEETRKQTNVLREQSLEFKTQSQILTAMNDSIASLVHLEREGQRQLKILQLTKGVKHHGEIHHGEIHHVSKSNNMLTWIEDTRPQATDSRSMLLWGDDLLKPNASEFEPLEPLDDKKHVDARPMGDEFGYPSPRPLPSTPNCFSDQNAMHVNDPVLMSHQDPLSLTSHYAEELSSMDPAKLGQQVAAMIANMAKENIANIAKENTQEKKYMSESEEDSEEEVKPKPKGVNKQGKRKWGLDETDIKRQGKKRRGRTTKARQPKLNPNYELKFENLWSQKNEEERRFLTHLVLDLLFNPWITSLNQWHWLPYSVVNGTGATSATELFLFVFVQPLTLLFPRWAKSKAKEHGWNFRVGTSTTAPALIQALLHSFSIKDPANVFGSDKALYDYFNANSFCNAAKTGRPAKNGGKSAKGVDDVTKFVANMVLNGAVIPAQTLCDTLKQASRHHTTPYSPTVHHENPFESSSSKPSSHRKVDKQQSKAEKLKREYNPQEPDQVIQGQPASTRFFHRHNLHFTAFFQSELFRTMHPNEKMQKLIKEKWGEYAFYKWEPQKQKC